MQNRTVASHISQIIEMSSRDCLHAIAFTRLRSHLQFLGI